MNDGENKTIISSVLEQIEEFENELTDNHNKKQNFDKTEESVSACKQFCEKPSIFVYSTVFEENLRSLKGFFS